MEPAKQHLTHLLKESLQEQLVGSEEKWKCPDGIPYTESEVFEWVKDNLKSTTTLSVGTDSHKIKTKVKFVTVVCLHNQGAGGNYRYTESFESKEACPSNKLRIFSEVEKSIRVAEKVYEVTGTIPVIHADVSPGHLHEFTSKFSDQVRKYVNAAGFECILKPMSFAANSVADKHSK